MIKTLACIVVAMGILGCDIQYEFLYHPNGEVPSDIQLAGYDLKLWPCSGDAYRGLVSTTEDTGKRGTVVVFHGNAGTAFDRVYYARWLGDLGFRVLLAEYPMYGGRPGDLGEAAFVGDAKETVCLAFEDFGEPFFLLGESLGCGVAAAVAKDVSVRINGIILITPWDTLSNVAKSIYPAFLVKLFLKDKYDTVRNLEDYPGPVAVVGAEKDEILPVRNAVHLYDSLCGNKKMWVIQNAGHNDWQGATDIQWWKDVMGFVASAG